MNLLEHYIEKVVWIEDVTNQFMDLFEIIDEPIYKVKMVVNCYGNKETVEMMWHKAEYETNIQRGYYFA